MQSCLNRISISTFRNLQHEILRATYFRKRFRNQSKTSFVDHQFISMVDLDYHNTTSCVDAAIKVQKQPFVDVLQNRRSSTFRNIHRKIPVYESLFQTAAGQKVCNFIKKILQHRCFAVNIAKFLRITLFIKHL